MEGYLTTEEVAKRLRTTPTSVIEWIKAGKLKAYQPVRRYLVSEEDLQAFLRSSAPPTGAAHP